MNNKAPEQPTLKPPSRFSLRGLIAELFRSSGELIATPSHHRQQDNADDALMPLYREVAFRYISLSLTLVLLPFSIHNLFTEQLLFGSLELFATVLFSLHCWRLFQYRNPLITPEVLVGATVLLICSSVLQGNFSNIYWAQSAIVTFYFLLPLASADRWAIVFSLFMIPASLILFELGEAVVFLLSLLFIGTLTRIFSTIVCRQQQRLQRLATLDPLTNCYNRRNMMETLEHYSATFQRHRSHCSIIMLDIDHFKKINDRLGHAEGDRVLQLISQHIQQRLRKIDRLFRYGGEEFLVVLPESNSAQAQKLAEDFCQLIESSQIISDQTITISCGVTEMDVGDSPLKLIKRCDEALYRAKQRGRNRVESSATSANTSAQAV